MNKKLILDSVFGILTFFALVFTPAWTFDYWQGWAYFSTAIGASLLYTIYLVLILCLFSRVQGQ
jgi:hypothetical protein